jgi:hypothetical protein
MTAAEESLVREVVRVYWANAAPGQMTNFAADFAAAFGVITSEPGAAGLRQGARTGRPIEVTGVLFETVVWTALMLAREAIQAATRKELSRRLDLIEKRLWEATGSPELVNELRELVERLVQLVAGPVSAAEVVGTGTVPEDQVPPPDLEIRVRTVEDRGRTRLAYVLHSARGVVPFAHREIAGPVFDGSPEDHHRRLLEKIERLGEGLDVDGTLVLRPEARRKLDGLGRELWHQLFNAEMRQAYRRFRESVQTLLIVSDEPWIPWEIIKPYDDDERELLDDEFFAGRFALTRWLAGDRPAPASIPVSSFACVVAGSGLPAVAAEGDLIANLARSAPGLRDASPALPGVEALTMAIERGGIGILHLAGHGTFDPSQPNEAGLSLADGSVFRPSDLHGPVQTQVRRDRPLVFLNACRTGRQAWSWTSLGGWADRWVRGCGCGGFVGPQWNVKDSIAAAFAGAFYDSLLRGETLGRAARAGRQAARESAPGDPGWLAYAVYGDPNARIRLPDDASREHAPTRQESASGSRARSSFDRRAASSSVERSETFPQPAPAAHAPAPPVNSRDLRIKRRFTDRDRDRFVEESFEYIASFFAASLAELQKQHAGIEASLRRVDRDHFTAAVYVDGKKESSCRVWISRGLLGDIAYASGDSGPDNSYNEVLSIADDGYSLLLKPFGLLSFEASGAPGGKALTQEEAAEYLWAMLLKRLR